MASTIGIKIANGDFYPLVEENSQIKKRLVLTTVHDNQPSVQIDLYRSPVNKMADAQYIGTVVVEKIKLKPKGEPSIEMVISSDANGNIIADAIDLDPGSHGEHYVLTVSLKSMDENTRDIDIPDFELESTDEPPSGLYQHAEKIRQKKKASPKPWIFILAGVVIILGLLAAWLFFFGGLDAVRSLYTRLTAVQISEPAVQPAPVFEPAQIEPVSESVRQPESVQPVIQTAVPQTQFTGVNTASANIPREGVNYVIRWGDTLWSISEAFYRDPSRYLVIARYNSISNPSRIISGRTIRIPQR